MSRFIILKNYIKTIFNFSAYAIMLISVIIIILNIYYFVIYMFHFLKCNHLFLTSDYPQIVTVVFSTVVMFVSLYINHPILLNWVLSFFGPLILAISSTKCIYLFYIIRFFFNDSLFFKVFGFAFYHQYTTEFLQYADHYLKAHNVLKYHFLQLPTLLNSNNIFTIQVPGYFYIPIQIRRSLSLLLSCGHNLLLAIPNQRVCSCTRSFSKSRTLLRHETQQLSEPTARLKKFGDTDASVVICII